jgi:ATP-dependent protease HslVU (ClpYQ) peptidase subunit
LTVIAAIATPDRVIMGSDTACDYGGTTIYRANGKIRELRTSDEAEGERVLLGSAGNSGIGPCAARTVHIKSLPSDPDDIVAVDDWAEAIAEAIAGALADANPPLTRAGDTHSSAAADGVMLLAWRQHLWTITAHSAIRPANGIAAIGCGCDLALGVMLSGEYFEADPGDSVALAVKLASRYIDGCRLDHRGPLMHETTPAGAR